MEYRAAAVLLSRVIVLHFLLSIVAFAGMGEWPIMDTDCTKIPFSTNIGDIKEIDDIISENYGSSEDDFLKLIHSQAIVKNKQYTAYKLCTKINDERGGDSTIAGINGVRLLAEKLLPKLGISRKTIKQALPTLMLNSTSTLRFHHNSCHIFGDYSFSICAKTENRVAIDERYERYKSKHGMLNGIRTKTIDYSIVELRVDDLADPENYYSYRFLDCGVVTWGECSLKRRPRRTRSFVSYGTRITLTQYKSLELEGIAFKFSTTKI